MSDLEVDRKKDSVLIVYDEKSLGDQIGRSLSADYKIFSAADSETALECIRNNSPDIIALDLMHSSNGNSFRGLEFLAQISVISPESTVIVVTDREQRELALKAIRVGAHDYFLKPFDTQEIKAVIRRASQIRKLEIESETPFFDNATRNQFQEIVGSCPEMTKVFETIKIVSSKEVDVLIHGESGTGKELVAKAIHKLSTRSNHPLVTINCGAIPENLLETELFGHEKGAFTDAHIQRKGKFEIADHGTIFLDEIGELSPVLQVKLLRFLQERKIERVGGNGPINVDIRVIAATNKHLVQEIKNGGFRDDLYYRICVINIDLPLLKERGPDIALLAEYFLSKFTVRFDSKARGFTSEAKLAMQRYSWPGNIRELENKIKRAVILTQSRLIGVDDLDIDFVEGTRKKTLREMIDDLEKESLENALFRNYGNVTKAADDLEINRTIFYNRLKKYGIKVTKYRASKASN